MPLTREQMAARAAQEIKDGFYVNLGIGMPEGVVPVAAEEGRLDEFTLTLESGPIGGMPAGGLSFGCSAGPRISVGCITRSAGPPPPPAFASSAAAAVRGPPHAGEEK